ncbi:MAG: hypothetical protein AB7G11_13995 [Phycisphaerales bacterium]
MTGILIGAYPTSIPDDALDRLRVLVERKAVPRAPRLAAWLLDLIDEERIRRVRTGLGTPREPAMPELPGLAWTDAEIGEALVVGRVIEHATTDRVARAFVGRANLVIVTLAAQRLARRDLTNSERRGT